MYYICNHCDEVFREPDYVNEREYHIDHYYENLVVECCPACGSTDLSELPKSKWRDYDVDEEEDEDEDDEWD